MASCLLAGCATTGQDAKTPSTHCSRGKARPANPNGSVLMQPTVVGAAPQGSGNDVMIFGNGADLAQPQSAPADAQVPAPPTAPQAQPAPGSRRAAPARTRSGRPISMAPTTIRYGSC
jgi:hypothetical protein